MEFRMETDLSVIQPNELAFNFEELHALIAEQTEKYKNLIVTEDGIAEAKKDRANLRKLADALNSEKIAAKKAFMKPYDEFEQKVKQLIDLCKTPAAEIDAQIKAFEEKKKAEKKARLAAHFSRCAGEAAEYVGFDVVFDPKWLNATVRAEDAEAQIEEICGRYKEDVSALNGMLEGADASTEYALKREYKATRSLVSVVRMKGMMEAARIVREERKKAEEKAACGEALKPTKADYAYEDAGIGTENEPDEETEQDAASADIEVCFRVRCTREQLGKLKGFLVENNIWYGRV